MSATISFSPQHGVWMLPRGKRTIECSTWSGIKARFTEFVELELLRRGSTSRYEWIDVVVAIVPVPENEYNGEAISVAQPITYGGSSLDRHMGFVYDPDHRFVGEPRFRDLARAGLGAEIGCHARLKAGRSEAELQLRVPSPRETVALIEDFLRRSKDPAGQETDRSVVASVLTARKADRVPPSTNRTSRDP